MIPMPIRLGKTLNLRLSLEDYAVIKELAKKHAGGKISPWIRYAALNYRPDSKEIR